MLKESRKEKTEYKILGLESTGTVLKKLNLDMFKLIYEIVAGYLPQPEKDEERIQIFQENVWRISTWNVN